MLPLVVVTSPVEVDTSPVEVETSPVDVETAYCKDELYLLQCRLITTLIEPDQT